MLNLSNNKKKSINTYILKIRILQIIILYKTNYSMFFKLFRKGMLVGFGEPDDPRV